MPTPEPTLYLPTTGLWAHYDATVASSFNISQQNNKTVLMWNDISGNAHHLGSVVPLGGTLPERNIWFSGMYNVGMNDGGFMSLAPFGLTPNITVFATLNWAWSQCSGAIAQHGNVSDWSLHTNCQFPNISGLPSGVQPMCLQSAGDTSGACVQMSQNCNFLVVSRISGQTRQLQVATGNTQVVYKGWQSAMTTASNLSTSSGSKSLWLGVSDTGAMSFTVIGELLYYNYSLSDGDVAAVVTYLQQKWHIALGRFASFAQVHCLIQLCLDQRCGHQPSQLQCQRRRRPSSQCHRRLSNHRADPRSVHLFVHRLFPLQGRPPRRHGCQL